MDIAPLPMSAETKLKVDYWKNHKDYERAIASFVESEGYVKSGIVAPAAQAADAITPADLIAHTEAAAKEATRKERENLAATLREQASALEFELDEAGEPRKTNANRAMQIVKDTFTLYADRLTAA